MGNSIEPNDIAFSCICNEPEGQVLRTVRHFDFSKENLDRLYSQISKFPSFMGVEIKNYQDMFRFLIDTRDGKITPRGLCMVIDDFIGVFWLADIKALHEASVHYTFFDARHRGRVDLCKLAIDFAFKHFQFQRLWTQVPTPAIGVNKFVSSLGFKLFGTARRNTYFQGKFHDTNMYDVLREEYLPAVSPYKE